jgi:hypothetical protein
VRKLADVDRETGESATYIFPGIPGEGKLKRRFDITAQRLVLAYKEGIHASTGLAHHLREQEAMLWCQGPSSNH